MRLSRMDGDPMRMSCLAPRCGVYINRVTGQAAEKNGLTSRKEWPFADRRLLDSRPGLKTQNGTRGTGIRSRLDGRAVFTVSFRACGL